MASKSIVKTRCAWLSRRLLKAITKCRATVKDFWQKVEMRKAGSKKFFLDAQKYLTDGKNGAIMTPTFFICQMRLSKTSSLKERYRELPGGARQEPEIR